LHRPPVARAGFILNSGSLHAEARNGSGSSEPPDVAITSPFNAVHSASWAGSSASISFGFLNFTGATNPSGIQVGGNTTVANGGNTSALGTVNFTSSGATTLDTTFNFTGIHGGASITIKDAANNTVFSQSKDNPNFPIPPPSTVTFAPGVYTLSWNIAGFPLTGTGGSTSWTWQAVPEPASLGLLSLLAVMLGQRRRRLH